MQEKRQSFTQNSCGFPWCSASKIPPGHGLHAFLLCPTAQHSTWYLLRMAAALISVLWILRTVRYSFRQKWCWEKPLPILSSQKQGEGRGVCCWPKRNNMERGRSIWIPWDNLDEIRGKSWFAGLGQRRCHVPRQSTLSKFGQRMISCVRGSWGSHTWLLIHYV